MRVLVERRDIGRGPDVGDEIGWRASNAGVRSPHGEARLGEQPTDGGDQAPLPRPLAQALDHRDRGLEDEVVERATGERHPTRDGGRRIGVESEFGLLHPDGGRETRVELDVFDCGERLTQLRLGRSAEHTHRRPSMQIGPPAERQRLRRLERNERIDGTIGGDSGQFCGGGRRDENRGSLIDPPLTVVPLVVREREHSVGFAGFTDPCRRPSFREGGLRIGACDLVERFPHGSDVVPVLVEGPPRRGSPSRVDERVLLHGGDRADVDLGAGDNLTLGCDQFVVTALEHIERRQLDSRPTGKIVTPLGLAADDQRRAGRSVVDGLDRPIDERLLGNPDLVGDDLRIGSTDGMGHSAGGVGEHRQALRGQHEVDHRGN